MERKNFLPAQRTLLSPIEVIALAALIIVPLMQAFRGLDVTDTGFVVTNQRFFFSAPQSVSYWFHLWLTNLLGGLVDLAFGAFGLLPHRLAASFIFWACALMVYRAFRPLLDRKTLILSLALTMTFHFTAKINVVHYNNVSALLLIAGASALCRGGADGKARHYFLAGALLALNYFARPPNAPGIFLVLLIPILAFLIPNGVDRPVFNLRVLLAYTAGLAVAVTLSLATMYALGQLPIYIESLRSLADITSGDESNYGLLSVIKRPIRDTGLAIIYGGVATAALILTSKSFGYIRRKILRIALAAAFFIAAFPISVALFKVDNGRTAFRVIAGVCYIAAAFVILDRSPRFDLASRLLAALSSASIFLLNIGSDTGIVVSTYVFHFAIPVFFLCVQGYRRYNGSDRVWIGKVPFLVGAFLTAFSAFTIATSVYRDVAIPERGCAVQQLGGIATSDSRATVLEEVVREIASLAPPGSKLLVYDSAGLLHFATRTLPYLNNPWPALYGPTMLDALLREKEREGALPVVVMTKRNPRYATWPLNSKEPVHTEPVLSFLSRNGYRTAWEDRAFTIFTTDKK